MSSASICDSVVSTLTKCKAVAVDNNDNIYAGFYQGGAYLSVIYKSTDGAATWDTVWSGQGRYFHTIFTASNNYVYAGQYKSPSIIRSTDGGATWDTCLSFKDDSSYLWQMAEDTLGNLFIGEYSLTIASLHRATIWKSTDDGATWDTIYHNPDILHIHSVAVDTYTNYLYATTDVATTSEKDKCVFLRSTNAGSTWDTIGTGQQGRYTGIEFSSNYRILADDYTSGDDSDIFITDDDSTFISVYTYYHGWFRVIRRIGDSYYAGVMLSNVASAKLYLLVSYDEGQHWSIAKNYNVGYNGAILHIASRPIDGWVYYTYVDPDHPGGQLRKFKETNDVKDESEGREKPSEFALFQNYPNPFNQSTKIEFTLARSGFVSLNIYDILGRKVRTLVSEHVSSGYKSVLWDGRNDAGNDVASGIYFYQLKVENLASGGVGDFTETKKLVLLK
ncbi:MAG: T9SS type A sorting domain-containing protein [candidate division Zixibacteria bacterium]|nr:T9SS type A sorting domain-containing protein [candidate division Zixibacteria bacterium]